MALLQDGQAFRKVIAAQAQSPLAQETRAKVSRVAVHGNRAIVIYTVLLAGKPALQNQKGTAIRSAGAWQMSDRSFCGLLVLQGSAPANCPTG